MNRFISTLITCLLFSTLGILPGFASGQMEASGAVVKKTYVMANTTDILISGNFSFSIHQGSTHSIEIQAPTRVFSRILVEQRGTTLKISRKPGFWSWGMGGDRPHAEVVLPNLVLLDINGASEGSLLFDARNGATMTLKVNGASHLKAEVLAKNLRFDINGASKFEPRMVLGQFEGSINGASQVRGMVEATLLKATVDGASRLELEGSGQTVDIAANGASTVRLGDYSSQVASARLNGASTMETKTQRTLTVNINGSSALRYAGSPDLGSPVINGGSSLSRL